MGQSVCFADRALRGVSFVLLLFSLCAGPCLFPPAAAAQDYEAMMPERLHRELRHAESAYRDAIDAANAAETKRLERKAAGASEDELRALDEEVGRLVTKAEKLKVQADYLDELYEVKRREYRNK